MKKEKRRRRYFGGSMRCVMRLIFSLFAHVWPEGIPSIASKYSGWLRVAKVVVVVLLMILLLLLIFDFLAGFGCAVVP